MAISMPGIQFRESKIRNTSMPLRADSRIKARMRLSGVVGVAYGVGPPQEHLEGDVGDLLPQQAQPLPGGLMEEAVGHVEGGAAPHLQGEAVVEDLCRASAA